MMKYSFLEFLPFELIRLPIWVLINIICKDFCKQNLGYDFEGFNFLKEPILFLNESQSPKGNIAGNINTNHAKAISKCYEATIRVAISIVSCNKFL